MPSSAERQSSVNRSTSQWPIPGPRLSGLWELKQTLKKNVTRGALSSGNLLPCPRASGLLLRTASAGLLSAYSENGMLVGDSRCNFRASAVVSSRLSRDSPWSCRTDDRGLEELASRISAMVFRGGGRCSCSHAGLAERYRGGTYPLGATSRLWLQALYLALACTARRYQSIEYSELTSNVVACNRVLCTQIIERATCLRHFGACYDAK